MLFSQNYTTATYCQIHPLLLDSAISFLPSSYACTNQHSSIPGGIIKMVGAEKGSFPCSKSHRCHCAMNEHRSKMFVVVSPPRHDKPTVVVVSEVPRHRGTITAFVIRNYVCKC